MKNELSPFLFATVFKALALSLFFVAGVVIPAFSAPIPEAGHNAARKWFADQGMSLQTFQDMPLEEAAKRLTSAVYTFCDNGSEPPDLNRLFVRCTAACGGYAYVLRGLLEVLGADTRYANFHNIPNQGNHTGVEVRVGEHWAYFDPTFGVYFTEDGSASGRTLSMREIAQEVPIGGLEPLVQQTSKQRKSASTLPLSELFNERFDHRYMISIIDI